MAKTITAGGIETKDLQIEGIEARTDVTNLAGEKEIADAVITYVCEQVTSQESLLEQYHEELIHYDYMFRCGRSATEKAANTPMKTADGPRSDVGASMFFRQIMQSSAKTFALQHGRDRFFKYTPVSTAGVPYSAEDGKVQAEQLNTLSKWSLDQDNFEDRVLTPIDMMIPRDGLALIAANWIRKNELRTYRIPGEPGENGEMGEPETITSELLTENRPSFSIVSLFSARFDPNIDTVQDQECFSVVDTIGMGGVITMVKNGYWDEESFKKLNAGHRWDGSSGTLFREEQAENADLTDEPSSDTGKFLLWRTWVNLPIDGNDMDEKTIVPSRYICEFLGNSIDQAVCMRIERNDDPDDEVPVGVVHDYPDSPGRFFHISKGHVLKNNYAVETTAVNQMCDGASLVQDPPLIERKGAVLSTNRKFGRGKRIVVKGNVNEDIKEFQIQDRTQTSLALLEYTKSDSMMAIHTDPSQMGEGLGARASATEASGVMRLSAAPSVMNAKYITNQLFTFVARKTASYWKAFSVPEQIVRITDSDSPIQDIRPIEIYADFDVKIDVVDEIVDDIVEEQKLSQDLALFSKDQNLNQMVDMPSLLEEYFVRRYKKSFISNQIDYDAKQRATAENTQMMIGGEPVPVEQTQDHRAHLDIHRAERLRYRGLEGDERFQRIELLDRHMEQHEGYMGQGQPQQQGAESQLTDGEPLGGAGDVPAAGPDGGVPAGVGQAIQEGAGQ